MNQSEALSKAGWSQAQLADLMTVIRGVSYMKEHASKKPSPGLIPILRATNIQSGLVFEDFVYVPRHYVSDEQLLRRGDIVIAASSGSKNIVGKAAQLTTDWLGSFGTFCFGLRAKPGVHPGYLAWFLQTSEYRHQVSELSAGVNINNLKAAHVEKIPIPLAPLSEQRRIVAEIEKQFTRLEAGVAALKRVQANLKRYRAAVLKAACEGRLVPTEAELAKLENREEVMETGEALVARILKERRLNWKGRGQYNEPATADTASLPPIPEGWTWVTLGSLIREPLRNGHSAKATGTGNGLRVFTLSAVTEGDFSERNTKLSVATPGKVADLWAEPGDIYVERSNTPELVGITRLYKGPSRFAFIPDLFIRVRVASHVVERYVEMCLLSERGRNFFRSRAQGISGTMPKIDQETVELAPIPLPPLTEQTRIVGEVDQLLSVVEELEGMVSANLQRASRLRQSILQKAFSGELVSQDLVPMAERVTELPRAKSDKRPNVHFARALLSAEIVHRLYSEPTFGRVKHQKIFHLCEHIARIEDIQGQYHREAAGPLDNKLIYANETELRKQKWYQEVSRESYGHAYEPLAKAGEHRKYVENYWPDKLPLIERLIELMRPWDTDRCEIFCTTYAAWNDLILWGKEPVEANILHEILERWHEKKRRISEARWRNAIRWIADNGFAPTGFGKPTGKPE